MRAAFQCCFHLIKKKKSKRAACIANTKCISAAPAFDGRLPHDRFHGANSSSPSPPRLERLPLIVRALIHANNVSNLSSGKWLQPPHTPPKKREQPVPPLFAGSTSKYRFQPFYPASKMHSVCLFRPQNAVNMEHERDIDSGIDRGLHNP